MGQKCLKWLYYQQVESLCSGLSNNSEVPDSSIWRCSNNIIKRQKKIRKGFPIKLTEMLTQVTEIPESVKRKSKKWYRFVEFTGQPNFFKYNHLFCRLSLFFFFFFAFQCYCCNTVVKIVVVKGKGLKGKREWEKGVGLLNDSIEVPANFVDHFFRSL